MTILVYEVPENHSHRTIEQAVKIAGSFFNQNVVGAHTREEVESVLGKEAIDLVFVHEEGNFEDIKYLREKYPELKYAGYSGTLVHSILAEKGTYGRELVDKFLDNYEYLAHDLVRTPTNIIKEHIKTKGEHYHKGGGNL